MLDSKQCLAFLAVAQTGSFEQAANKLYISASAVTQRIQALEKSLGQLLLIRARPCSLTKAGQHLFEHLKHTQRLEDNLNFALSGQQSSQFFKTIIATNADSLATWLLPVLKEVLVQARIVVEFYCDDQSRTFKLLEQGVANACISLESQPLKGCTAHYLGVMRYKMIARHDFSQKWFAQGVNRQSLAQAPAIIFNEKDQLHFDVLWRHFALDQSAYVYHVIPSSESFITALQLGLGYAMLPELQLKQLPNQHQLVQIYPEADVEVALYWHHWQQQSEPLQGLTRHVLKYARHLLKPCD